MSDIPRLLCTFPGRHGDLLWALPTVRAISETYQQPVTLVTSAKYGGLADLIRRQPYIAEVLVDPTWEVQETAPMTPRAPQVHDLAPYDRVFHLGYRGWPSPTLPVDIWNGANHLLGPGRLRSLDLDRPWITVEYAAELPPVDLAIGFTDEWFELKYGLYWILVQQHPSSYVRLTQSPRWNTEGQQVVGAEVSWTAAAAWLSRVPVFVGCCSALHVLAIAAGCPKVIVVEPNRDRCQDVFFPLGKTGRVELVLGGDGQPTFDARHVREAIDRALGGPRQGALV